MTNMPLTPSKDREQGASGLCGWFAGLELAQTFQSDCGTPLKKQLDGEADQPTQKCTKELCKVLQPVPVNTNETP